MKISNLKWIIAVALVVLPAFCGNVSAQSRSNRISSPCPSSSTPSQVSISPTSTTRDITIAPCSGGAVTISGTPTFSGVLKLANGTAAAPSLAFTNSATTGFYRAGSNQIGIAIAGVNAATWSSSGLAFAGATSGTITLTPTAVAGTSTLTLPAATDTLVGKATTDTLTNKRITPRVCTTASTASLTIDSDSCDSETVTALAAGLTINAPTGTPTDGQRLLIRIKDNGTPRALTFNAAFRFSSDLAAPTTTVTSKTFYMIFVWNSADSKWDNLSQLNNF